MSTATSSCITPLKHECVVGKWPGRAPPATNHNGRAGPPLRQATPPPPEGGCAPRQTAAPPGGACPTLCAHARTHVYSTVYAPAAPWATRASPPPLEQRHCMRGAVPANSKAQRPLLVPVYLCGVTLRCSSCRPPVPPAGPCRCGCTPRPRGGTPRRSSRTGSRRPAGSLQPTDRPTDQPTDRPTRRGHRRGAAEHDKGRVTERGAGAGGRGPAVVVVVVPRGGGVREWAQRVPTSGDITCHLMHMAFTIAWNCM